MSGRVVVGQIDFHCAAWAGGAFGKRGVGIGELREIAAGIGAAVAVAYVVRIHAQGGQIDAQCGVVVDAVLGEGVIDIGVVQQINADPVVVDRIDFDRVV